jgi:hypothetical protein
MELYQGQVTVVEECGWSKRGGIEVGWKVAANVM